MGEKSKVVLELRKRFRKQDISQFLDVVKIFWDDGIEAVVEMLVSEEERAIEAERLRDEKVEEMVAQIRASELHHQLNIQVPEWVDLEHAQAILIYGFIMPGSQQTFMGANKLPTEHVKVNVKNKLSERFDDHLWKKAWSWLASLDIIQSTRSRAACAHALRTRAIATTSQEGKEVLREVYIFINR